MRAVDLDRFRTYVDKSGPLPDERPDLGPCWLWTGSTHAARGGYGQFNLDGRNRKAHQVSYEAAIGPIPDGRELDHLCRRPSCVRPSHLEAVTRRENFLRGNHPIAVAWRAGTCLVGHPMTAENTAVRTDGSRRCRICKRAAENARRARARMAVAV